MHWIGQGNFSGSRTSGQRTSPIDPPFRILAFMERYLTWHDSKQSSKMHRTTALGIRYCSLAPAAVAVRDAVAAL